MPHIILKHNQSTEISPPLYETFFKKAADILASNDFCSIDAIKCYTVTPQYSYLPTKSFFFHIDLLLLERDSKASVNEKAKLIRELAKTVFNPFYKTDPDAFTFEIRFMKKDQYFKADLF